MKLLPCNNGELYVLTTTPTPSLKFLRHPSCDPEVTFSTEGLKPIPRIIHQTWATRNLHPDMQAAVNSIKTSNPGWSHRLYDDDTARRFIIQHFGSHVTWAYDTLIPGTYKADLFRYCVMYIYGGVYLDIKYVPVDGFSFESWLPNETYVLELGPFVYQGCFMCPPKHPRLKAAIECVVKNVRLGYYGDCHVCTTGPHMFGRLFTHAERMGMSYGYRNNGIEIFDRETGVVLMRQYDGYRTYQNDTYAKAGTKYWSTMWKERNIFDMDNFKSRHCPSEMERYDTKLTLTMLNVFRRYLDVELYGHCKPDYLLRILTKHLPEIDTSVVPKNIYLYWHSCEIPQHMSDNIEYIKRTNPAFSVHIYNDITAKELISTYFEDEVIMAYLKLIPYAFASDLWRLCILYIFGGYYIDVKYVFNSSFHLDQITEQFLVKDRDEFFPNKRGTYNAFIVVKPRTQFILDAIYKLTYNCLSDHYGPTCLYPTGPGLLGIVTPSTAQYSARFCKEISNNNEVDSIIDISGNEICRSYNMYRNEQNKSSNRKYYSVAWNEREIYDKSYNRIPCNILLSGNCTYNIPDSWITHIINTDNIELVLDMFAPVVKWAYHAFTSDIIKLQLAKYCALYIYGGLYINDCQLENDIVNMCKDNSDSLLLFDNATNSLISDIVGMKQYSPYCLHMITVFVEHAKSQYYASTFDDFYRTITIDSIPDIPSLRCSVSDNAISIDGRVTVHFSPFNIDSLHDEWNRREVYKLDTYPCPY